MRMPDLLGMLSIALECVPQGAKSPYPELTAVWMLCEDLKIDVTPSLIIKKIKENNLLGRKLTKQSFYNLYFGRKTSERFPNWAKPHDLSMPIFDRMSEVVTKIMLGR